MSEFAIEASLSLQWFLEDELDRARAWVCWNGCRNIGLLCPSCGFYEVSNGLTIACRRKRITQAQADQYLTRLRALPIVADHIDPPAILGLGLTELAHTYELTNYDAAYLELAIRRKVALAKTDIARRRPATRGQYNTAPVPLVRL